MFFRMILDLEHSEVIYGDGIAVHKGLRLSDAVVEAFLEIFQETFPCRHQS